MALRIALPGGRVVKVKADFPYEGSPIGYRVLIKGRTGLVVGLSEDGQELQLLFPEKLPITESKNLEAIKDTALIYGLPTWQLLWELMPSAWDWTEETFLEVSSKSFVALDPKTKEILKWIAERKKVREELAKKKFGSALVDTLIKKGLLKIKKEWSAPDVEVEVFSLNVPLEVAISKLRKNKRYSERLRLLGFLRERLYATREELKEEGFSSQDIKLLVSAGLIKVEKELMQNFSINPKAQLRVPRVSLLKKLEKPLIAVGSLKRLTESLFELVEESLSKDKSLVVFSFYNPTLSYLLKQLKPIFGDRVVSVSSFETPKQLIKNWFLAQERGRIILTGRLGLLLPLKDPYAFVLFDDYHTKLKGYIDLRNVLFQLHRYHGCHFFYYTCALGVDTYYRVKTGQWELEHLGYEAKVKLLKRKPEEILTKDLLSELEDHSLLLVRKTGYSYAYCPKCVSLAECPVCKTFLTLSKDLRTLFCTRCKWKGPPACPRCDGEILYYGFGIERVVEELEKYGLVKDTIHFDTKPSASAVYKKVFLVHGDNLLSVPSITAEEEFWKYLRRALAIAEENFYIQTFLDEHIIEHYLSEDFLQRELEKRKEENLPPFSKLIFAVFTKERTGALSSLPDVKIRTYGNIVEAFLKVSPKQLKDILPSVLSLRPLKLEVW
ncbi:hypothetical protein [Thermocrinis sp.]